MADENLEDLKKRVDESWKDTVHKEKASGEAKPEERAFEINFGIFIAGLMMEALIALGDLENPATHKKEANLQHAKILIDTLEMLQAKTKNNLDKEEDEALNSILYDLRMRFVAKANKPTA